MELGAAISPLPDLSVSGIAPPTNEETLLARLVGAFWPHHPQTHSVPMMQRCPSVPLVLSSE